MKMKNEKLIWIYLIAGIIFLSIAIPYGLSYAGLLKYVLEAAKNGALFMS